MIASLTCAGLWGATDALGGISARRSTPLLAALCLHLASLFLIAPFAAIGWHFGVISISAVMYGVGAGVLAAIGDVLFGRASASSTMTVGIPLANVIAAALPATVAAIQGDPITPLGAVGIVGALVAGIAAALPSNGRVAVHGAGYAIAAGICFGGMYALLTQVAATASVTVVFVMRVAGTVALIPGLITDYKGWGKMQIRAGLMPGVLSGVASVLANSLFVYAMSAGDRVTHSVVAIGLSAPAGVIIAFLYQREKVNISQTIAASLALGSIAVLAVNQTGFVQ